MSAWYSMNGTVRVRRCREVAAVVAKIQSHCDQNFTVALAAEAEDDQMDQFSIEGAGEFAAGGVLILDELLLSLGPYALDAAVLTGEYENEPCELVIAPTPEAAFSALSRHRLEQIKPALRELNTEDKKSLVALLTDQDA